MSKLFFSLLDLFISGNAISVTHTIQDLGKYYNFFSLNRDRNNHFHQSNIKREVSIMWILFYTQIDDLCCPNKWVVRDIDCLVWSSIDALTAYMQILRYMHILVLRMIAERQWTEGMVIHTQRERERELFQCSSSSRSLNEDRTDQNASKRRTVQCSAKQHCKR
jgi:hypothetical protein